MSDGVGRVPHHILQPHRPLSQSGRDGRHRRLHRGRAIAQSARVTALGLSVLALLPPLRFAVGQPALEVGVGMFTFVKFDEISMNLSPNLIIDRRILYQIIRKFH